MMSNTYRINYGWEIRRSDIEKPGNQTVKKKKKKERKPLKSIRCSSTNVKSKSHSTICSNDFRRFPLSFDWSTACFEILYRPIKMLQIW